MNSLQNDIAPASSIEDGTPTGTMNPMTDGVMHHTL